MAVTKEPSYQLYAKKAIRYICNPEKTDGTLLIDSYGCTPETADIEFEWTRKRQRTTAKRVILQDILYKPLSRAKQRRNRPTKSGKN